MATPLTIHDVLSDRYREAESIFQECSDRKATLRQTDLRLIADSTRLIAESRELLSKLDKFLHP